MRGTEDADSSWPAVLVVAETGMLLRLDVLPGDVDQSREGREVPAGRVRSVMVVVVQPVVQLAPSFGFGGVAAGVSPSVGQGAVEALYFPLVCGL